LVLLLGVVFVSGVFDELFELFDVVVFFVLVGMLVFVVMWVLDCGGVLVVVGIYFSDVFLFVYECELFYEK